MPHICEYATQEPLETCRKHVCFEAFARTSALKHSKWKPLGAPPLDSPRNMLENTSVLGWPGAIARGPVRKCACFRTICVPKPRPQRPSGEQCLENTCVLLFWERFWSVLERPGAFWSVLARSGAFWSVPERAGPFWGVLERSGAFWSVLGRSGALWSVLGRSGALRSGALWAAQEHCAWVSSKALFKITVRITGSVST